MSARYSKTNQKNLRDAKSQKELAEELEELELDDDSLQLEDEEAIQAAKSEVVGGDVNVTQALRKMHLEDAKASSDKAAEN
jgi:hypothetical protein